MYLEKFENMEQTICKTTHDLCASGPLSLK